jgi:hypothetical protein
LEAVVLSPETIVSQASGFSTLALAPNLLDLVFILHQIIKVTAALLYFVQSADGWGCMDMDLVCMGLVLGENAEQHARCWYRMQIKT